MSHTTSHTSHRTALTAFALSGAGTALVALGPLLSVLAAPATGWDPVMVHNLQLVLLVAWCPLVPVSVPALLTQDLRDLHRAARCGPLGWYLLVSGPPSLVAFSWFNLAGLAAAAAVVLR